MKRMLVILVLLLAVVAATPPASAGVGDHRQRGPEGTAENQPGSSVGREVRAPGGPGGSGGGRHEINHGDPCGGGQTWNFRPTDPALNARLHEQNGTVAAAGEWVYMRCGGGPERIVWSRNLDANPADVARDIADSVDPPPPSVHFSPEGDQLVGVETWLWVENEAVTPPPLTLQGVRVSVTFTPGRTEWDMGDNSKPVECPDTGTPYDRSRPAAEQSTDCQHTYRRSTAHKSDQRYHGQVTMWWEVSYTVSNQSGTTSLDDVSSTESFALRVAESQAVVG